MTGCGDQMHSPPETLILPGAELSRVRERDGEHFALAVRQSLEHLRPWMPWATEAAAAPETQRARCRQAEELWSQGSDYLYVLRQRAGGPLIGTVGLHRRIGPSALEIGYWLHVDWTGLGHATAAAAAVTAAALALPDIDRVEIHTDEANTRSAAIPQRLGYRLDRVDHRSPQAPAKIGRQQIWIADQGSAH